MSNRGQVSRKYPQTKTCVVCFEPFEVGWRTKNRITCGEKCQFRHHASVMKEKGMGPCDFRDEKKWLASVTSEEYRQRTSQLHTDAIRSTPFSARFSPDHAKAVHFWVCSPDKNVWRVDNICGFVHAHEHLFSPEDVAWKRSGKYNSQTCRAVAGLSSIRRNVETRHQWKGWTITTDPRT